MLRVYVYCQKGRSRRLRAHNQDVGSRLFSDNKGDRDKILLLCSHSYKIACFVSLFEVRSDNELVCLHTHGTEGAAESGTS